MKNFKNKIAVITGGTDGMGAATALKLCELGATVFIMGRSQAKADAILEKAANLSGTIEAIISDFSLMKTANQAANLIVEKIDKIDILIHGVGILISRTEHTAEGIEKDFAIGYLSRFVFTEELFKKRLLHSQTKMINIAASSPKIPKYFQMEFNDIEEVEARVGMTSHGQAQLANDLYTAITSNRYGITAIGYGPGSVDTSIRREVPKWLQVIMKPFFKTRKPEEVANQFVEILSDHTLMSNHSYYFNKNGKFEISPFIANTNRQKELLETTVVLSEKALNNKTKI